MVTSDEGTNFIGTDYFVKKARTLHLGWNRIFADADVNGFTDFCMCLIDESECDSMSQGGR